MVGFGLGIGGSPQMLFVARQLHRSVSFCSMHVLSAVFIDGARLLSRGSIVDTLQGIPALIKEKMKLRPHTQSSDFVWKRIFLSTDYIKTTRNEYFRKRFQKEGNGSVSCIEKW